MIGRQSDPFHPKTLARDGSILPEVLERVAEENEHLKTAGAHDFVVVHDSSAAEAAAKVLQLAGW